jgi:hypothetical protein
VTSDGSKLTVPPSITATEVVILTQLPTESNS